eukprot:1850064-Rhodomonas_salina.1
MQYKCFAASSAGFIDSESEPREPMRDRAFSDLWSPAEAAIHTLHRKICTKAVFVDRPADPS